MSDDILNTEYRCPLCNGERFIIGARGGLALNVMCAECGVKWWL
jgi:transcription elongation factor Elf1